MKQVVQVTDQEMEVLNAYRTAPQLKVAVDAMVAVVKSGALSAKPERPRGQNGS